MIRFLYSNKITSQSMITASSVRTGITSSALKDGSGSAVLTVAGTFSGTEDIEYIVEIDSISGGAEVGQATFKWSDGGSGYNASGVLTATAPITLNNGVTIAFASGTGADFVVGDKWYFKAINNFSVAKMLDYNRDSFYRSSGLDDPNTFIIDLETAKAITGLVIYDHNISVDATITLQGNASDSWGAPSFEEVVTYNADKLLFYIDSETYRYWRVVISDETNSDSYIQIGELFLGEYFEPVSNFSYSGGSREIESIITRNKSQYGREFKRFFNNQRSFDYDFNYITDTDDFVTMFDSLGDRDTGKINPIYLNESYSDLTDFWLTDFEKLPYELATNDTKSLSISLKEIVKSV